ncbi:MAG: hypothetical protein WC998_00485 [Candidatus Paceibacterota bacterium]|jgi:hypothetical protein
MPIGKEAISENDFYRAFRMKVRDPLLKKFGVNKDEKAKALVSALDSELPTQIYSYVTVAEKSGATGLQKFFSVLGHFSDWMNSKGLGEFTPYLLPIIQHSVVIIYNKYFDTFCEKYGLESFLEGLFGFSLDKENSKTPSVTAATSSAAIADSKK